MYGGLFLVHYNTYLQCSSARIRQEHLLDVKLILFGRDSSIRRHNGLGRNGTQRGAITQHGGRLRGFVFIGGIESTTIDTDPADDHADEDDQKYQNGQELHPRLAIPMMPARGNGVGCTGVAVCISACKMKNI